MTSETGLGWPDGEPADHNDPRDSGLGWPADAVSGGAPKQANSTSSVPPLVPPTPLAPPPTPPGAPVEPAPTQPAPVEPTPPQAPAGPEGTTAHRQSLVREALAKVASSPRPAPAVSRETPPVDSAPVSRETQAPEPPHVSRETPDPNRFVAAFANEDTPIAAAAAAALRVSGPQATQFPRPVQRRILTVANQKGGVGKTTTTVNIAAAMALRGLRVLCIDLDPQGNASTGLGVDHRAGTPSIYDVLIEDARLDDVIQAGAIPNLFCAPATIDLAGAEIELVSVVARESRLKRAIDSLQLEVDYVLIDCPPSLGLLTVNALVAANEMLIPIQCEYYALEGLGQLLRNVDLVRSHLNPAIAVTTILLTMYDARTRLAEQVAQEVRSHFGPLVLDVTIPRSVRISEAPGYGQSVLTYDPASRGAIAYLEAAREIAERGTRPHDEGAQ